MMDASPHARGVAAKIEEQANHINEQEATITSLTKQLSHYKSALATHMDLVKTLEASLSESEQNLRKARMHATELARERDSLLAQLEPHDERWSAVTDQGPPVEEKVGSWTLETRLDEERRAKERARAQLESRMEELRRRKSKFACI